MFAEALLNRANTKLISSDLSGAAEDFRAYQTAAPTNPQKEKIDEVLTLLDQAVVDEQAIKLAEESRKKKEEELKQAAAAAAESERLKAEATAEAQRLADVAAAEAERQKQEDILARIRESLAGASGDSKTLSTGPTGAKADDSEASLE